MKRSYTLAGACLSATLLAACGGANNGLSSSPVTSVEPQQSQSSQPASARSRSHGVKRASETLTYLHSFGASGDGTNPYGPLVSLNGTLYGTTLNATGVCGGGGACGTQLVSLGGVMYGTTLSGGQYNHGTVYSIAPSGAETVLHSFGGSSADGENPYGGLLNVNGTLYGTTSGGGTYGQGTLYSITPNGTESVLWSFGNQYDGAKPRSSLININGLLYGTTIQGGTNGSGTVFTLSL